MNGVIVLIKVARGEVLLLHHMRTEQGGAAEVPSPDSRSVGALTIGLLPSKNV